MTAVRLVVEDVDAAIVALTSAGCTLEQRWGPPFAIMRSDDTELWVSGPGTSAAEATTQLTGDVAVRAAVRLVREVDDIGPAVEELLAAGWETAAGPVTGPGGSQVVLRNGPLLLEVFAAGS